MITKALLDISYNSTGVLSITLGISYITTGILYITPGVIYIDFMCSFHQTRGSLYSYNFLMLYLIKCFTNFLKTIEFMQMLTTKASIIIYFYSIKLSLKPCFQIRLNETTHLILPSF